MRGRCVVGVLVLAVAGSCRDRGPSSASGDVLEIELGGDAPTVHEILLRTAPAAGETPPAPEPVGADPEVPPVRTERTVALAEGQTISDLCLEWLGDANRWREVLALNGWTEAQAARLRPGRAVRLPLK